MEEYDAEDCKCGEDCCEKNESSIKMGKEDCALVLRAATEEEGFAVELVYPDHDPDSIVSGAVEFITAVGMRISDPEFIDEQFDWLKGRLDSLDEMLGEQEVEIDLEEKPE